MKHTLISASIFTLFVITFAGSSENENSDSRLRNVNEHDDDWENSGKNKVDNNKKHHSSENSDEFYEDKERRKKQDTKRRSKPNLIYILLDDVGRNDVGWYNEKIQTPYMNKLAEEGVILEHFYAMPQCTPSRTTLLTGMYAQQLGLQRGVLQVQEPYGVPLKAKMLPMTLKEKANYMTHAIGKWHLGYCDWDYTPLRRGFDTFFGFYTGAEENYNHCLSKFNIYDPISNCTEYDLRHNTNDVHNDYMGQYSAYLYAKQAEKLIKSHAKDKPLFMYVSLTDAHFPLQPPERFYKGCENNVNKARKTMCAAMQASDEVVKNITETLKKEGMYENSVIVISSDNGGSVNFAGNNYPFRGNKQGLWEGGTRVPAFVHSPLLKKTNYVYNGIFHIVDWYATFMYLAGIQRDRTLKLQGVNQWNAISENKKPPRNDFPYSIDVIEGVKISAVRKGDYKLIAGPGGTPDKVITEKETKDESFNTTYLNIYVAHKVPFNLSDTSPKLFNIIKDPTEKHNLAEEEPEKLKELQATLKYYERIAKNAVKFANDPAGDPANFGNVYSPGWCNAFYGVPDANRTYYMNINRGDLV